MKFSVDAKTFASALAGPCKIADAKSPLPILGAVKVSIQSEKSKHGIIEATNLECGMRAQFPCKVLEEGDAAIPAAELMRIVRSLRGEVSFSVTKSQCEIKAENGEFRLAIYTVSDFPIFNHEPITMKVVDAETFCGAIRFCEGSCDSSEARPFLRGVHILPVDRGLIVEATQGHVLQRSTISGDWAFLSECTIMKEHTGHILSVLGDKDGDAPEFGCNKSQWLAQSNGREVFGRTLQETFPDADRIFPAKASEVFRCVGQEFASETEALLEKLSSRVEVNSADGVLTVSIPPRPSALQQAEIKPSCEVIGDANGRINLGYLARVLSDFGGDVSAAVDDTKKAGMWQITDTQASATVTRVALISGMG